MRGLTISKAAKCAGVGVETIRFYERKGLIEQPSKSEGTGYRTYPAETIERIRFIRQAQELGFSLREAWELLSLRADPGADAGDVRARANAKLAGVNDKICRLQHIGRALERLIDTCPGRGELGGCSIMEALDGETPETAGQKTSDATRGSQGR